MNIDEKVLIALTAVNLGLVYVLRRVITMLGQTIDVKGKLFSRVVKMEQVLEELQEDVEVIRKKLTGP